MAFERFPRGGGGKKVDRKIVEKFDVKVGVVNYEESRVRECLALRFYRQTHKRVKYI